MNSLKITIDPYKELNSASLDGRPLSPYSEMSNYLKKPLLFWADKVWDAAEREINDYFELTVASEEFDKLLLADMAINCELCKGFHPEYFNFNSDIEKRYNVAEKLSVKYGLDIKPESYKLPVFQKNNEISNSFIKQESDIKSAFIVVSDNDSIISNTEMLAETVIVLITSDNKKVSCVGDSRYIWMTDKDSIQNIVRAAIDRFARVPFINKVTEKLNKVNAINSEDRQIIELASSIEPLISVGNIDRLEVGASKKLNITSIPANQHLPIIRIEATTNGIVETNGLTIKAISAGETTINLYKGDEIIPFCKKRVVTYQDKSAKSIILDRKEPKMCINKTQKIGISFLPADAEDASFVIWSVDNPSLATVDDSGTVTAKKAGRIYVTASTQHVKESVIIDILPNIEQMSISQTEVRVLKGENVPIAVTYAPQNCFDNTCKWATDDSNVANVEVYQDGTMVIKTKEPGECYVTCEANEGGCSISCHVIVLDPTVEEEKEKKKKHAIDIACMIGIPVAIIILAVILSFFL